MANEISVTGNKKLKTLYKEFNKNFPYICGEFILSAKKEKAVNLLIIQKCESLRSEPKPVRETSASMGVPMPGILRKISKNSSGFIHRLVIRNPMDTDILQAVVGINGACLN